MAITVYGYSDDLIEVDGDISDEFPIKDDSPDGGDLLAFSDGTLLRITYTKDGIWRITALARGSADLSIEQAHDNGTADDDERTEPHEDPARLRQQLAEAHADCARYATERDEARRLAESLKDDLAAADTVITAARPVTDSDRLSRRALTDLADALKAYDAAPQPADPGSPAGRAQVSPECSNSSPQVHATCDGCTGCLLPACRCFNANRAQGDDLADRLATALATAMRSHPAEVHLSVWRDWEALLAEYAGRGPAGCPACTGRVRETVGMVCMTCGTDYALDAADPGSPEARAQDEPRPGQFCHRHFSWLCQAGQGRCQGEPVAVEPAEKAEG